MKKQQEEQLNTIGAENQKDGEQARFIYNALETAISAVTKTGPFINRSVLSAVTLFAANVLANVHHDDDEKEVQKGIEKFCSAVKFAVTKKMHLDEESERSDGSSGE